MDKCECGQRLPTHLLGIMSSFEHVCVCGRVYKDREGTFVPNGTARNPVAEYDGVAAYGAPGDKQGRTG